MKRKTLLIIFIAIVAVIVVIGLSVVVIRNISSGGSASNFVVATMDDKIGNNASWCGTFQLVWNDFKNEVVKGDVKFTPQLDMIKNLNKGDFNRDSISDEYYYIKYGQTSPELKEEIEYGIKEKFNQSSDILNNFDWSRSTDSRIRKMIFYTMLYRDFKYYTAFDILEKGKFGRYNNIQYFGIDSDTEDSADEQISVLYYNSQDDFALKISTTSKDDVIFCKNPSGSTFNEIYENMIAKSNTYTGKRSFKKIDEFKAPYLNIKENRNYSELTNQVFKTNDPNYPEAVITNALQTIEFKINETGGSIKSEAGMAVASLSFGGFNEDEPRYFYVDDTFALFLKESKKDKPYFAAKITDIIDYQ